ncbi:hypothetical protein VNO80_29346 [Phaseolus coccineus]|uniref:Uncharacterized protein n=1 Tax=Phaseolus coccineus TaxID=3886 RepID=A0AAN9LE79_PHACN
MRDNATERERVTVSGGGNNGERSNAVVWFGLVPYHNSQLSTAKHYHLKNSFLFRKYPQDIAQLRNKPTLQILPSAVPSHSFPFSSNPIASFLKP